MEENKREILAGRTRGYIDEDNILHLKITGKLDYEHTTQLIEAANKLTSTVGKKVDSVIDISDIGLITVMTQNLGKKWLDAKETGKVAIFGAGTRPAIIAKFVLEAIGKKDIALFKTEEDALKWLKA